MLIMAKPNFPPYCCLTCGVSDGRQWFVSLDFTLDHYFNPLHAGVVFQCNECWQSLATSVAKEAQLFMAGQEPWAVGEYVTPSYDNSKDVVKEVNFGPRTANTTSTEPHLVSTINSGATESSNTESSSGDQPTDNPETDDDSTVSEFRDFFGGGDGGSE